jgi:hypothetical protein
LLFHLLLLCQSLLVKLNPPFLGRQLGPPLLLFQRFELILPCSLLLFAVGNLDMIGDGWLTSCRIWSHLASCPPRQSRSCRCPPQSLPLLLVSLRIVRALVASIVSRSRGMVRTGARGG